MRILTMLAMATAMLSAADLRLDHATIAGRDLQAMQARLAEAGIHAVYGGAHTNHATEMALVSFPDGSYLELMGIQAHADETALERQPWAKELRGDAGPCAWAARAPNLAAEAARLKAAGIAVGAPERGGRERPDGVRLDWETADVGSAARGTFFPFLIQDFTPRAQRAYPQGKPVTRDFEGVRYVVIAVRSLDAAVKLYRRAFGFPEPLRQVDADFGAQLASFGSAPVILAQPLTKDSPVFARIEKFGEGPYAIVLGGARNRSEPAAKSRWFGMDLDWLDRGEIGWLLGYTRR